MFPAVEDGRVQGVITDRDIVIRAVAGGADAQNATVQQCFSGDPLCARPNSTADEAMQEMAHAQVGRLPVVDDSDRLVGVVTRSSMALRCSDKGDAIETAQEVSRLAARASAA